MVSFFLFLTFDLYFRRLRGHFGSREGSKSVTLARFLVTFRGPGTHVRIELSLQSQHDLEGSGGSQNRCFLYVFCSWALRRYPEAFFDDFWRSRESKVTRWGSQMVTKSHKNHIRFLFPAAMLQMSLPGCLREAILEIFELFWDLFRGTWTKIFYVFCFAFGEAWASHDCSSYAFAGILVVGLQRYCSSAAMPLFSSTTTFRVLLHGVDVSGSTAHDVVAWHVCTNGKKPCSCD